MQYLIFQLLSPFRPLFTRQSPFIWFIVIIFGFLIRFDHYGVSSFVRWLSLPGSTYPLLLHFFHASSWSLSEIMMTWMRICQEQFSLVTLNGRLLVIGDGIKIPKEAQCQPGIKSLHSPSQNQSKPQHFSGHHFGCIAFVSFIAEQIGGTYRAILQTAQLHEGVDYIHPAENEKTQDQSKSVVSRMMSLLVIVAIQQGKPLYAALDALFSTSVAFSFVFHHLQENGAPWVHLITRAKNTYVAYIAASQRKTERIKLWSLFDTLDLFTEHPHPLHPNRMVKVYYRDLYWGKTNFFLRFIWVIDGTKRFILMSSDLQLTPLEVLKLYGLRFQIEFSFRVLKHLIGGFSYRFWSSLCHRKDSKEKQAVTVVDKEHEKAVAEKSLLKLTVIERYVNLAIIAQGILSYLAIVQTQWVWSVHEASSWLRSYSSALPSDEIVQRALQSHFLTTFSLQMVKDWINSNHILKLPDKRSKVRNHPTLQHFLTS